MHKLPCDLVYHTSLLLSLLYAPLTSRISPLSAHLRRLSEALSADLYGTNVKVQTVCFGLVTSNYFENNKGSMERLPPGAPVLSPEQAAQAIERAIQTGAKYVVNFLFCCWSSYV